MKILCILIAIFLPPLGVYLHTKNVKQTLINLVLTLLLFGIGGVIHALYLVLTKPAA